MWLNMEISLVILHEVNELGSELLPLVLLDSRLVSVGISLFFHIDDLPTSFNFKILIN